MTRPKRKGKSGSTRTWLLYKLGPATFDFRGKINVIQKVIVFNKCRDKRA